MTTRKTGRTGEKPTPADIPLSMMAGQRIVRAQFSDGGRDYAYFAGELELEKDDYVVVASPYGDGGACFDEDSDGFLKVVRVTSIDENLEGIERASKWIIGKVDVTEYRERRRRVEQMRLLSAKIERARKAAVERMELEKLAEFSPELKDLVGQMQELQGVSAPAETAVEVTPADKAPEDASAADLNGR